MKMHMRIDIRAKEFTTYCGLTKNRQSWVNHTCDINTVTCKNCIKAYEKRKEQK